MSEVSMALPIAA